jgi:hypothetical protein
MTRGVSIPAAAGEISDQEDIFLAVSRLLKEKKAAEEDYRALGLQNGRAYARQASYLDVLYVAESFWLYLEDDCLISELVFPDVVIGEVIHEAIRNDPHMILCNTEDDDGPYVNSLGDIFIRSFIDGVRQFWTEVEDSVIEKQMGSKIGECVTKRQLYSKEPITY